MLTDKDYNQVEHYVEGSMTPDEKKAFELEMNQRPQLAKVVAMYQDVPKVLQKVGQDLDFNQKLKRAAHQYESKQSNASPNRKYFLYLILALIVGVVVKATFFGDTPNTDFKPPAGIIEGTDPIASVWESLEKPTASITRSTDNPTDDESTYIIAFEAYQTGNYTAAMSGLSTINEDSELYNAALLLKGVSAYEMKDYNTAIESYAVYKNNGGLSQDLALWYQAIAYAKNNQKEKAKENLQVIINEDYPMKAEANYLLQTL